MKYKLSDVLPAGSNALLVKKLISAGYILSAVVSIASFIISLFNSLREIYSYSESGEKYLNGTYMKYFAHVRENSFDIFRLLIILMLLFAVYNFISHYMGSKSIYTMRRLRNPAELMTRCLFVPVIMIIASIVTVLILNLVFIGAYVLAVPGETFLPYWKRDMWRVF